MNKIKKFFIAYCADRRVWRVTYPDGKTTRLLYYNDAANCAAIWKGKK